METASIAVAVLRVKTRMTLMTRPLKIAFVVGRFYTEASGVAQAVACLAKELTDLGHDMTVFAPSYPGKPIAMHMLDSRVRVISAKGRWCMRLGVSPELRRCMSGLFAGFDLIHSHGLWMLPTHYATTIASRSRIPVIASTHGFLDVWALRRSAWKKHLASLLFQKNDLRKASVIHALSPAESRQIKDYVKGKDIAVIPNGVSPQAVVQNGVPERILAEYPQICGRRVLLFMSRLHIKKGLDILIDAWDKVHHDAPEWLLVIAGPDDGYEASLIELIRNRRLHDSVLLVGPQFGQNKQDFLASAECFVLPSRSEGLPIAALEAMAAAKPVVYTTGCYLPEAAACGAGYEVSCDPQALATALRRVTSASRETLTTMGIRGRELVQRRFSWPSLARHFIELYQWVLAGKPEPAPEFVQQSRHGMADNSDYAVTRNSD